MNGTARSLLGAAAAADGTAAAAEADFIDEEQDGRVRDMMGVFGVLAGGQPEGPGGAVLDEVDSAVARAMGLRERTVAKSLKKPAAQ